MNCVEPIKNKKQIKKVERFLKKRNFRDLLLFTMGTFNHYSPSVTLRYIGIEQDEIDNSYLNFIL